VMFSIAMTSNPSLIIVATLLLSAQYLTNAQPTCTDVKEAYRTTACCGAPDASTRTVDLPKSIYRERCSSRVAQNITSGSFVGGTLYVYDPAVSPPAWKTISGKSYVDIADSTVDAGCVPKHKPHMVRPSPDGKYTAVTYTGDQDFAIFKNDEYKVVGCPTVDHISPSVFGGATHDGAWYGNNTFLLLDMTGCVDGTCGGAIHKFSFGFDASGTMTSTTWVKSLSFSGVTTARGTTSSKPISLGNNPTGPHANIFFVTDAKGAGSTMNADTMTWVTHFPAADFGTCVGGGLWVEPVPTDPNSVVAIYGKQGDSTAIGYNCIFKIDMATQTLSKVVQLQDNIDTHGLGFCQVPGGDLNLIITNRQTATLDVVRYSDGAILLQGYDMNAQAFDAKDIPWYAESARRSLTQGSTNKLQPDVMYYDAATHFLYMAARGPAPVSAVKAQNFFVNARPGMYALKINGTSCMPSADQSSAFALTTLERSPAITSDVHSIWPVPVNGQTTIWTVDQAGTGSVQQYQVYSKCSAYGTTTVAADPATSRL